MYQFDFVLEVGGQQAISVVAETYPEAVKKIKAIGIPGLNIADWTLEAVVESTSIILG